MTTDAIRTCVEKAERQARMFSHRVQWTPLLLMISIFAGVVDRPVEFRELGGV